MQFTISTCLRPLLEAGIIERIGGKKTGRYFLKKLE